MIVNARMYSVTPGAKRAWRELLQWVTARARLAWEPYDHDAPARIAALWDRDDLGCVAMCGVPYAQREPRPTLVAAPVPSPERYLGHAIYFTDIVVRAESSFQRLEDTFGGTFGYTLRDSMSGYVAPRAHMLVYRRAANGPLYRRVIGGFSNASEVIEALGRGEIDVGPLDSYCHDLLKHGAPEVAATVRTVATTRATPMPPFVATGRITREELVRLQAAFTAASTTAELLEQRRLLLLKKFAFPGESEYAPLTPVMHASAEYPDAW